jgi:quercetin dioxygenase-like cupin family protein
MRKKSSSRTALLEVDIRNRLDEALCPPRAGDDELLDRVRERVMTAVASKTVALHRTIRAEAGVWETVATGVERKLLWETADAVSCLMRLAPGAVVAGHPHRLDEECVVLEGSLRIGRDLMLRPGDFHVGVKGVDHDVACTDTGALVYLRGAKAPAEAMS